MSVTGAIPPYDVLDENIEPRSVSLPNLKKLRVHESLELVVCLMRSLAFPSSASIDLHDANDEADEPPSASVRQCMQVLIAALDAHYAHFIAEGRTFRSLFLRSTTRDRGVHNHRLQLVADCATQAQESMTARTCLMTDRIDRDIRMYDDFQDRPLSISLCNNKNSALRLVEIFTGLPLFREARAVIFVEQNWMSAPDAFSTASPMEWTTAVRNLQSIQVAHLGGYIVHHHIDALLENNGHATSLSAPDLIIEDVSFLPKSLSYYRDFRPARMPLERFILALEQCRGVDGHVPIAQRLNHIELIHCDVEEGQIIRLRREFGDDFVTWDGLTRGSGRSRQRARMRVFRADSDSE